MRLEITSETGISFEIEMEREGAKATALVELSGGQWMLVRTPQKGSTYLSQVRVPWPEVLKRALIELAQDIGQPL